MTAGFNIALPSLRFMPRLTQTWTVDEAGNWVREARELWHDERGWHDRKIATPTETKRT